MRLDTWGSWVDVLDKGLIGSRVDFDICEESFVDKFGVFEDVDSDDLNKVEETIGAVSILKLQILRVNKISYLKYLLKGWV